MNTKLLIPLCLAATTLTACSLAPTYVRPTAPVTKEWPVASAAPQSVEESHTADIGWRSMFRSPKLQSLIEASLANNRDLRIAALNIEAARHTWRIQRSDLLPSINSSGNYTRQQLSTSMSGTGKTEITSTYSAGIGTTAYELDLFGRVRSLSNRAINQYLATEEGRKAAQTSLVAEVANAYLTYLADVELLRLTESTLKTRQDACDLIKRSFDLGAKSRLDVAQSATLVESARASRAQYQRHVEQDKNALTLLVGKEIDPTLLEPQPLADVEVMERLPVGIPSVVLLDRPDVRQAEYALKAENANIGAARASFFPSISLTGSAGFASASLSDLFEAGSSGVWSFAPQVTLPIFQGGRLRSNLKLAETNRDIAVTRYEKAIQSAFREVADALVARATYTEQLQAQQALVKESDQACTITKARYDHGIDSSFALLDAQRSLFEAQQNEILIHQQTLANLIDLYKALGGGWQ
ncbi:efflux transporter outer membrane subunit [Pelodictyon phaeoclathratiforme]|jgi:multidrug efflux system outer membrane protein|uniref:RND efflux system, outer membrane lipoprotein, NodT family n=1 Tax=Pelodictyon phaeoclathratiforme (strain DSM 5477 / BU-1) TaxID=324925 RepID=B4SB53_PELPB|nr:efflux transporter outer membrane subunit [Pelodictyon phaeoclathratiforme]ACF42474.1 RND efflux system, outer membrane lipoprotein, NodT family [Pelodictyon phaeoclathratiforme BU-1]